MPDGPQRFAPLGRRKPSFRAQLVVACVMIALVIGAAKLQALLVRSWAISAAPPHSAAWSATSGGVALPLYTFPGEAKVAAQRDPGASRNWREPELMAPYDVLLEQRRELANAAFSAWGISQLERAERDLTDSLERLSLAPQRGPQPPSPLHGLGVVVVALDNRSLTQICTHVDAVLHELLTVRRGTEQKPLLTLIAIAAARDSNWTVCDSLLKEASFAVALVESELATYADALLAAASVFDDATSHVLAVETRHGRAKALLTASSLRRIATIDTSQCVFFSCAEFDPTSGVVESAGLEPIVTLDGELRHFRIAHYGGFLESSLASNGTTGDDDRSAALVKPTCMLTLRRPLSHLAAHHRSAIGRTARHGAKAHDKDNRLENVTSLTIPEARKNVLDAFNRLEACLLELSVREVGANVAAANAFQAIFGKATEWTVAAADMLHDTGDFTRAEPYTPRRTYSDVTPAVAHEYVATNTTALALAVIGMWRARRDAEIAESRNTPLADSTVELSLRLSTVGRSCLTLELSIPIAITHPLSSTRASAAAAVHTSTSIVAVGSRDYEPFRLSPYLTMRAGPQLRNLRPRNLPIVAWYHLCCYCCGFSNEIVHLTVPLQRYYPLMMMAAPDCFCDGFNGYTTAVVNGTSTAPGQYLMHRNHQEPVIWISHTTPMFYNHRLFECNPPSYLVGRSMFEFSVVPRRWLTNSAIADEIWVPSQFVLDAFMASGFERSKLVIVPESIDTELFTPLRPERFILPHCAFTHMMNDSSNIASNIEFPGPDQANYPADFWSMLSAPSNAAARRQDPHSSRRAVESTNFKFFSAFKWEMRKGWDVLVRGFLKAFRRRDRVSLYIATSIFATEFTNHKHSRDAPAILSWIHNMSDGMRIPRSDVPHVVVITSNLEETEVAALYRSADAFVLPTRGEGWGLPVMQAMASGLPAIATNYSGQVDFMVPGTALPIRVRHLEPVPFRTVGVVDADERMQWAVPDEEHLVGLLKWTFAHPDDAQAIGEKAARHIAATYSEGAVYRRHLEPNLKRIAKAIEHRPMVAPFGGRVDC
jgi:glycosyltransferase involved in cell wall biosynthesis/plasmid stabilization system protein ParE